VLGSKCKKIPVDKKKFIWQGSLKVNPSVLMGSFLVGISPYKPFPWKRSEAVYLLFSESQQIQNKHGPSAI